MSVLAACADPPFPEEPAAPGGGKSDDPSQPAPKGDAKTGGACTTTSSGWSCLEIGQCAGQCGINLGCIDACKSKGCEAGKTGFNNLSGCVQAKCLAQCLGGFNSSCEACQKKQCVPEDDACGTATCSVTTCAPGGSADGGASPADGGAATPAAGATCYELMDCATQCGSLWGCVDQCRAKACKPAKIIFDKLVACALGDCGFDCLIGYNAYCRSCLMSTCPADWKACEVDACQ